jgi:hypothetical protein
MDGTPEGGAPGQPSAGAAGSTTPAGGTAGQPNGGSGTAGSIATCANPQSERVAVDGDTWIGAAKPQLNHGKEKQLLVAAGAEEERLLVSLSLPATPAGSALRQAKLRFHLESNADAVLSQRRLGVHRLLQALDEARATWLNWGKNTEKWDLEGGDFGVELAHVTLAAGTSSGNVDFDVTAAIAKLQGPAAIPLSLIVLESSPARPAPAELAFTSREGNASQIPELLLEYCDP